MLSKGEWPKWSCNCVIPKKFKFLQGGLVTGAGAMEGVDCVRSTSMI